jgi:hypothetical protein
MTGRYGNRRGGRGGRGRGRTSSTKPVYTKKTVEDYFFYVGSSKQASDYEITNEFVVNHIKKTFDRGTDVAEDLRRLLKADTNTWKPTLKISTDADDAIVVREDKQFVMEYKAELDEARKENAHTKTICSRHTLFYGNAVLRQCKTKLHQDPTTIM